MTMPKKQQFPQGEMMPPAQAKAPRAPRRKLPVTYTSTNETSETTRVASTRSPSSASSS